MRLTFGRRMAARTAVLLGLTALTLECSTMLANSPGTGVISGGQAAPAREIVKISADGFMPDWIDGLTIVRNASEDPECPWSAAYPKVPNAAPLTRTLRAEVRSFLVTVRKGGIGPDRNDCIEPVGSPGLQIGFDFLIASADVVGVRMTFDDAASSYVYTQTYWYDGRAGTVIPAPALFAPSALPAAVDGIVDELSRHPGADQSDARAALSPQYRNDTLHDLSFDSQGALHARFTAGEVAPSGAAEEAIIPRQQVAQWLSSVGRRAQEQAMHPEHRLTLTKAPAQRPDSSSSDDSQAPGTISVTAPDVDCQAVKCIALTFDDGPSSFTAELLADLAQQSAHATFFVLGQDVVAHPELVRAEIAAGHEIGNHSWSHPQLPRLSAAEVSRQLSRTDEAIRQATGTAPTLFRPPYGLINARVRRQAARPVILWNRDTEDWKVRNAERVAANVIATARPGDIVLMHDIHHTTVQAVPTILTNLSQRGFHFVTISQLLGSTSLTPGRSYFSNPSLSNPH